MNVKGFLSQALPWISAAATSNVPALVSLAAQTVAAHTGAKVDASHEDIAAAVAGATPDQIAALKQADNDFALKMQALGFQHEEDLQKLAVDDRASARAREVSLKDRIPAFLAIGITIGFFGLLGCLLAHVIPPDNKDVIQIMLGALGASQTAVVSYYFGSSSSHDALVKTMGDEQ